MIETTDQLHARAQDRHRLLQRDAARSRLERGSRRTRAAARSAVADLATAIGARPALWPPTLWLPDALLSAPLRRRVLGDGGEARL